MPAVPPSLLDAFGGRVDPTPKSLGYRLGLVVVTLAMVLLPVAYVALIGLTAYGVWWHARHDAALFPSAGVWSLIAYLSPIVAGATLVFFMVKPLLARRPSPVEPLRLDPAREPLLFGFIERICTLVRAPTPAIVLVDCRVNASAGLTSPLLDLRRTELVLTIGLPLVGGMTTRQLAGVLAHEFGHFTQGASLRSTAIVRSINHWFARVVYERDAWDEKLARLSTSGGHVGVVLLTARLAVWCTRKVLWLLMLAGQAISCTMMRQMEYDADGYEAKIAGSDSFGATSRRLRHLGLAAQLGYADLAQGWREKRVPDNFPSFVLGRLASLPLNLLDQVDAAAAGAATGVFDTHPSDADRQAAVELLDEPGVFQVESPASTLFSDFGTLARAATGDHYRRDLSLEVGEANFVDSGTAIEDSRERDEARGALARLYGETLSAERPIDVPRRAAADCDIVAARRARSEAQERHAAVQDARQAYDEAAQREIRARVAGMLIENDVAVSPQHFGLRAATPEGAQDAVALACADRQRLDATLGAFESLTGLWLSTLLALGDTPGHSSAGRMLRVAKLRAAQEAIVATSPTAWELRLCLWTCHLLKPATADQPNPPRASRTLDSSQHRLRSVLAGWIVEFGRVAYPFAHPKTDATIADYLCDSPDADPGDGIVEQAAVALDRFEALQSRILGHLARLAEQIDAELSRR